MRKGTFKSLTVKAIRDAVKQLRSKPLKLPLWFDIQLKDGNWYRVGEYGIAHIYFHDGNLSLRVLDDKEAKKVREEIFEDG